MEERIPAEARGDYRFFRFLAANGARVTVVCLFLIAWNLAFYYPRDKNEGTLVFLGSTAGVFLGISLLAALVSYSLYKRRGGKIEKTVPPPESAL